MSLFVVDVESDGPVQGSNSMVCFGAVKVTRELNTTFYGRTKPISDIYDVQSSNTVAKEAIRGLYQNALKHM